MNIDIISMSEEELGNLDAVQQKLVRTAQQKKDALERKLNGELAEVKRLAYSNGMQNSSQYQTQEAYLTAEYQYQVELIREQLLFNMSLREPTNNGETGDSGSDNTAYIVDYELSYVERYALVRDYYLTIEDPSERLALFAADTVAVKYLASYYNPLYSYFRSLTQTA